MITNQYWQHKTSGDTYAVQVDESGAVVGACGPLYFRERTQENIDDFNFNNDQEVADDLNDDQDSYRLADPAIG